MFIAPTITRILLPGVLTLACARAANSQEPIANGNSQQAKVTVSRPSAEASASGRSQTATSPYETVPSNYEMPRITVTVPPPSPAPWTWRERLSWIANLTLIPLVYAGITIVLSVSRKMERHANTLEMVVGSASQNAQTALLYAQALIRAERPWLTITAGPRPGVESSSVVVATNRGRSPARIVGIVDRVVSAVDEAHLSLHTYGHDQTTQLASPVILLPGDSTEIRAFGRNDVTEFCTGKASLKRIEDWDEKIFVYGKVIYQDFVSPSDQLPYESSWCCWYIYGQKKSGLVTIGVPEFNVHT